MAVHGTQRFITFVEDRASQISVPTPLECIKLKLVLNSFCQGDVAVGGVAKEGKVWLVQFGQAFHQIHRSLTEVSGSKLRGVSAAVVGDKGGELKTGYPPDLLQVC